MKDNERKNYELAAPDAVAPTPWSYWAVPRLLLAGPYPGDRAPDKHQARVRALLDAGIRTFVNLMEEHETNYLGEPFAPYDVLARRFCHEASCSRHAIRDQAVPTREVMMAILDAIDVSLAGGRSVYVHCWGGVGRTGTVIGCWLLRHGLADPANVLEVLAALRRQDRERGARPSPETGEQRRFVRQWLPEPV